MPSVEDTDVGRFRLHEVPSIDDLDTILDYLDVEGSVYDDHGYRLVESERERRRRTEQRLDDVPSLKDLYKIKQFMNQAHLEARKQGDFLEDDTGHLAGKEIRTRRTLYLEEHLDNTERYFGRPRITDDILVQQYDNRITYIDPEDESVTGVSYTPVDDEEAGSCFYLHSLAERIAELTWIAESEDEPEITPGNDPMFNAAKATLDFKRDQRDGELADESAFVERYIGGETVEDMRETFFNAALEGKEELDRRNTVYFQIDGFNMEEITSLIHRIRPRDGFTPLKYETAEDLSMNEDEWHEYHKKWVLENTDENNALRLFYEEDEE